MICVGASSAQHIVNTLGSGGMFHVKNATDTMLTVQGSSGNVGVGTTSPAYRVDVNGAVNATAISINGIPVSSSSDTYWTSTGAGRVSYSGGKVGINTGYPEWNLDVGGQIQIFGANTATKRLMFKNSTETKKWEIQMRAVSESDRLAWLWNDGSTTADRMVLTTDGRLAIGSNSFNSTSPERLKVDAGTTTSYNVISGYGTINNYLQLNIKNGSPGVNASSDLVATANNGSESDNFVDLGINSSGYNNASFSITGPNDAYLFNLGQHLSIGTGSAGKSIKFHTSGTLAANERMRIDSVGNIGIGTSSPTQLLDINGSKIRLRTANTPESASATGEVGEFCWDADYLYVCVATDTWKRVSLTGGW